MARLTNAAKLHGYDYQFLRLPAPADRHPTWIKVPGLLQTLPKYKFVVFLDADAVFNHMYIPMEWLLNYWSITPDVSLAMAIDYPGEQNNDAKGRPYVNTGFIIAQNNLKTLEILDQWNKCPNDQRWPECSHWNRVRFHEQSAFGEYVRYDYREFLKELPCGEANGEWDMETCKGVFVQHRWWRTEGVRDWVGERVLQRFMERLHDVVVGDEVVKDRTVVVEMPQWG